MLKHYFTANIISVERRRSILLYAIGASTNRLICTLVSLAKVSEVSFRDIVDLAKTYFCPKLSPIAKREKDKVRERERERERDSNLIQDVRGKAR